MNKNKCALCNNINLINKTPCNHYICFNCLINLENKQCPKCKYSFINKKKIKYKSPNIKDIIDIIGF